jgi:hypothetical protein
MPRLKVRVQSNGQPLRRVYVEHLVLGVGNDKMYITDDRGRIRDEDGNLGIDSFTNNADIRILCQNSVAKVLNGNVIGPPLAVYQDTSVTDGSTVNLNTASEQEQHFEILNRLLSAYDIVFRQFQVYGDLPNPDFPLGRNATLRSTKDKAKRIEVSFPGQTPAAAAWTEPSSLATGYPLIQLRQNDFSDRRRVVPAEISHALHFVRFTQNQRVSIETDYAGWIATDVANGGNGRHRMGRRTSPKVAFIEALDHFSHRFSEHVRHVEQADTLSVLTPQTMTAQIRQDFLARELSGSPDVGITGGGGPATLDGLNRIVPNSSFNGSDDEGSVYGCIFLDFGRQVGLRTAVNAYLRSADLGVTTFGGYKTFIANTRPQHLPALEAAQQRWGL